MKKTVAAFLAGVLLAVAAFLGWRWWQTRRTPAAQSSVCYSCFWKHQSAELRADLAKFYQQFAAPDEFVRADVRYILWRVTGQSDCDARELYHDIAGEGDADAYRRFLARAIYAVSGAECGDASPADYANAAVAARDAGLPTEAQLLGSIAEGKFAPQFEDVEIKTALHVPPDAKLLLLGATRIELAPGTKVGAQVDRVARDWLSYQMRWNMSAQPLAPDSILDYHEGRVLRAIAQGAPIEVYPLSGTLVARRGEQWFAPDETGVFRFEVLPDKVQYSTTHADGSHALLEDTHGISALVSQALARKVQLVIGCGDSTGKAKAAYYLARRGVHVLVPGDRYEYELLGYDAPGVILGTAPVRHHGDRVVVGDQPVRFSLAEPIVVQDTNAGFPIQYYDAGARYFRKLAEHAKLNLDFVLVDDVDQIGRVLERADQLGATAVAVRVMTEYEDGRLRSWLRVSPHRRAILFHSGLYPWAQPLFRDFPAQVTFGDLHPRFE